MTEEPTEGADDVDLPGDFAPEDVVEAVSTDPLVLSPADVAADATNLPAVVQPQHPYEFLPYSELTSDDIAPIEFNHEKGSRRGLVLGGLVAVLVIAVVAAISVTRLGGEGEEAPSAAAPARATTTTTTTEPEPAVPAFTFEEVDLGWNRVTSEDGRVTFEMPGAPRVLATAAGGQANLVADGEAGIETEVIYSPIKEEWAGDPGRWLAVLGVFERATDVAVEDPEEVDGLTVIDAEGLTDGGTVHARVLASDDFAITLIQRTPDSAPPQAAGGTWVRLVNSADIG